CHVVGTCNPATGTCSNPTAPNGTSCNDGSMCTQTDSCQAGTCTGSNPVVCTPSDQCHAAGSCNPATGMCSNPNAPDGTSCNDGNLCTQTDSCSAGVCGGGNPVTCAPLDQCHVAGTCNPGTGTCDNPTAPNGTTCNDGNLCTQTDTCTAGSCGGGNPVTCAPLDQCHVAGTCSPGTGLCDNPTAPDGTSCTVGVDPGSCSAGTCVIAPQVTGVSPIDAATGVATSTVITVAFNVPMNISTLTVKSTLDSGPCSGSIQVSDDNFVTCIALGAPVMSAGDSLATITPAPGLSFGSNFKVKITTAAQNSLGVALMSPFEQPAGFTTVGDLSPVNGSVVISQVYGAGGNMGASHQHDFIELHNRGTTAVSLAGWAVQYANVTGMTWQVTSLTGSIAPGGYYLVREAGGTIGVPLPTPDVIGTIPMGASSLKVALTNTATALTDACPVGGSVVDFIGVGPTANCAEGTPTAVLGPTLSASRNLAGYQDTSQNSADFTVGAVNPRNSATATQKFVLNETGAAAEADFCNVQFPLSLSVQTATSAGPVFCQVFEAGETETPGAAGTFTVEVGYGPIGSNPENQAGWTWFAAPFNTDPLGQPNNDEYFASFTAPAPGSYRYACRVLRNNAVTYCDTNGAGSNPGLTFDTPHEAELIVTP
ncbi:MAG: hypothetical protein HOV80_32780, partial [Polyangiaceae bacterium]|nr:hypothetical protein [Polyangiaceae bacterium]